MDLKMKRGIWNLEMQKSRTLRLSILDYQKLYFASNQKFPQPNGCWKSCKYEGRNVLYSRWGFELELLYMHGQKFPSTKLIFRTVGFVRGILKACIFLVGFLAIVWRSVSILGSFLRPSFASRCTAWHKEFVLCIRNPIFKPDLILISYRIFFKQIPIYLETARWMWVTMGLWFNGNILYMEKSSIYCSTDSRLWYQI